MQQMVLNPEDVMHGEIKHNSPYRGCEREFTSRITIAASNIVSEAALMDSGEDVFRSHIYKDHIRRLDQILYGQYRNFLIKKLMDFVYSMNKYHKGGSYHGEGFYIIPETEIYKIQSEITEIIKGLDEECPNIRINADNVKT